MGDMRITGLASGMDVDGMVKKMMKPYVMKSDKLKQDRQLVQWRQDLYRDIMKDIKVFTDTYFDIAKKDTCMLSENSYATYDITSTPKVTGGPLSVVATAGAGAKEGTYEVNVNKLAKAAIKEGSNINLNASKQIALNSDNTIANLSNWTDKTIGFTVNGDSTVKIDLTLQPGETPFSTLDQLKNLINKRIQSNDQLNGKVQASVDNGTLKFNVTTPYDIVKINGSGDINNDGIVDDKDNPTTVVNDLDNIKARVINVKVSTILSDLVPFDLKNFSVGDLKGKTVKFSLTGNDSSKNKDYEFTMSNDDDIDKVISNINEQINKTDLKNQVQAVKIGNSIQFKTKSSEKIDLAVGSEKYTLNNSFKIQYNGITKDITVNSNDSVINVLDRISKETDGEIIGEYSELTGKFTFKTKLYGNAANISFTSDNDKINSLFGLENGTGIPGQDAIVEIKSPGQTNATILDKSTNLFMIDGITYDLKTEGFTTINISSNVQKTFDKIKGFIDKYNELIDKIGKKVEEKTNKGFVPLTDEQKKDMKAEEIEKWEAKAKEGILKNDSSLQAMLSQLRGAFFQGVEDAGMTLTELGLSTSNFISDRGKIVFDIYTDKNRENGEERLKRAIKEKGDKIVNIFTKKSEDVPRYNRDLTSEQRTIRTSQEGILHRINDIFQDYVTPSIDKNGNRGILVQKAGIKGTSSEIKNFLYDDLQKKDRKIKDMEKSLRDRENKFYIKFAQLEKAMNQLNSQSSWLAQQLGGGK